MALALLSARFQSLLLPVIKLGPSGAYYQCVSLCTFQDPMGLTNKLPVKLVVSSTSTTPRFIVRDFQALFSCTRTLGCIVCLIPQLFLLVYPHANVGLSGLPVATLPTLVLQLPPSCESSPPCLPVSAPPPSLGECFFFNSLVIGLPYSLIFWQFQLFLFVCF